MTTLDRPESDGDSAEVRAIAAERLTFFADAVVAIAVTLLALDLPVPAGDTNGAMLRSVLDNRDGYLAFGISFLVIASHWRAHHRVFRYVTHLDSRLTTLTLAWLFTLVVTPFATRVITGNGAFQFRFGFYSVVQVAAVVLFALMSRDIERKHLSRPDTPAAVHAHTLLRTVGFSTGFLLSIPISFVTNYSYVCWIIAPVAVRTIQRIRDRHSPGLD
jgi:uncharacterized membrane protein